MDRSASLLLALLAAGCATADRSSRARADLVALLTDSDYPASALRAEEQGITEFTLDVGPDGRVTACAVTASSGSAALDAATCRIMAARAQFVAARDRSGRPTSDRVSSRIVWRLAPY